VCVQECGEEFNTKIDACKTKASENEDLDELIKLQ
jgi:hypothetical protein